MSVGLLQLMPGLKRVHFIWFASPLSLSARGGASYERFSCKGPRQLRGTGRNLGTRIGQVRYLGLRCELDRFFSVSDLFSVIIPARP